MDAYAQVTQIIETQTTLRTELRDKASNTEQETRMQTNLLHIMGLILKREQQRDRYLEVVQAIETCSTWEEWVEISRKPIIRYLFEQG